MKMNTEEVTGAQYCDSAQTLYETAEYNVYATISKIYDKVKEELEKTKEVISLNKKVAAFEEVGTRLKLSSTLPSLDWEIWLKALQVCENARKVAQGTRQWKAYNSVQSLYFIALDIVRKTQEWKDYDDAHEKRFI